MSDAILGAVVSAIIAGAFSLISKRMELSHSRNGTIVTNTSFINPTVTPPLSSEINYGIALRHIGILQFALNIVGFILGFSMGTTGASIDSIIVAVLIIGTILLIVGFIWSALLVEKSIRWKHLFAVAIGVVITTLVINSIFLQAPISLANLLFAFAQSFASMGVGGYIANKINIKT